MPQCARAGRGSSSAHCKRVVLHWHGLHREMAESPSLEMFRKCKDLALRHMVSGQVGMS